MRASFHLHVIRDERLIVRSLLLPRSVFLRVSLRRLPLLFHTVTCTLTCTLSSMWTAPREHLLRLRLMRSLAPWRYTILPQVMSPTSLTTSLFIQEREEPADRRQAYHSHEESLLSAQYFFTQTSTGRPVHELSSCQKRKSNREMENERIRILLERRKEQILTDVRTEIQKHEFQAHSDRRSIQELNGIIESQRREIDHTLAGAEQLRRDQLLLHEQVSEQNRDLREARIKSLYEMEELKRVQGSRVDEFSRRRLIDNQDTINELTAGIQELQNEVNCLNDSRVFKVAESVRSGQSHVPSQPALLHAAADTGFKGREGWVWVGSNLPHPNPKLV